ncbi:ATP-binding protein [Frigidibacter oleivorans]|uniref:ATP-binding protein n=1 Tax=Frigidibacter oleivorans TaxID=2487129 RepID=UPI000F8CC4E1|nr:ATP-binding protein [Frigidibacter oleivorans]
MAADGGRTDGGSAIRRDRWRCGLRFVTADLRASHAAVRDLLIALRPRLGPDRGAVEIVLAEALNNVVEHAYAGNDGRIALRLTVAPREVRIRIGDSGRPMPGLVLPRGLCPHRLLHGDVCDLPEGGFGWLLIRELASGLRYRQQDGRNLLRLVVRRG